MPTRSPSRARPRVPAVRWRAMRSAPYAVALTALVVAVAGCDGEPSPGAGIDDAVDDVTESVDDVDSFDDDGAAAEAEADAASALDELVTDAWTAVEPSPSARTEVGAASYLDKVWVVGGLGADDAATGDVAIYDPSFDAWESGPALPERVHHAAVTVHENALVVLGGYVGDGFDAPTAGVWRLDPATGEWEEGPALPAPRAAGAAASDGDRIVYGGGVGPDGLAGDVWALDGGEWARLDALGEPREHLAAASDGEGRVWLLGGRAGGLNTNLAAVDLVEGESVRAVGELPTPRGGLAGFFHPEAGACAVGGEEPSGTFAAVECVDADGEVTVLPALAEPRHGLGAAVVGDLAYTVMGGPEPGLAVSETVEALRLDG